MLKKLSRRLEVVYEKFTGLDFSSVIEPAQLGYDEQLVFRGSPSGNVYLKNLLSQMKITPEVAILDIGCAKGSALRCMSNFPFNRVDGIELSQKLAATARLNFSKLKKSKVQIFNVDALDFDAYGDYNFFYLYNPFPEAIMAKVLAALSVQLSVHRESLIIYNNPKSHDLLERNGFHKVGNYPDLWGNGINIYSNTPSTSRLRR
jgi:SAM-dependent methyltransferase